MGSFAYDFDYFYKVVLIGDSGVGKSNLLSQFSKNVFRLDSEPTMGVEYTICSIQVEDKIIQGQIWELCGQERYRSIINCYYGGSQGALIVYDITQKATFENVKQWLKDARDRTKQQAVVVMLIGNKADLAHLRTVPKDEAEAFSKRENILYMETSALDALNVEKAFTELLANVYIKRECIMPGKASYPAFVLKRLTSNNGGKDDQEGFHGKYVIVNLAASARPTSDPQLCEDCLERWKNRCITGEAVTCGTERSNISSPDQELKDFKELLEAVRASNVEVLTRDMAQKAELDVLRTSVDVLQTSVDALRSTVENLLAQQPTRATGPTTPHEHGKFVFNLY